MRYTLFVGSVLFVLAPILVFAANTPSYTPLAPIPGITVGPNTTLGEYVNSIFLLVISIAAMLAVLRIVTGGFKYMIEESVSQKGEARGAIQSAVIGLILLLSSVLILTTINPQIVNLQSLNFSDLYTDTPTPTQNAPRSQTQTSKDLAAVTNIRAASAAGFDEEIKDAARVAAGIKCTNPTNAACDTAYPVTVRYGTNYVEIDVTDDNYDPSPGATQSATYGKTQTVRIYGEKVQTQLCEASTASKPIPGC